MSGSPTGRPETSNRMEVPVRVGDIMSGRPIVCGERSGDGPLRVRWLEACALQGRG